MACMRTYVLSIVLMMLPLAAHAGQTLSDPAMAVYVRSGMQKQIGEIPQIIQAGFDQGMRLDSNARKIPPNIAAGLKARIPEVFAADGIEKTVLKEIRAHLTQTDLGSILQWLDTPLGEKCTRLEEASSSPETLVELEHYAAQLQTDPPSAERIGLIRDFLAATKSLETSVSIIMHMQMAVATVAVLSQPVENQRPLDQIRAALEKNRPQIESSIASHQLISSLYTYRSLSDSELEKYIAFIRSPIGTRYHAVASKALLGAMEDCSIRWGKVIVKTYENADQLS